MSKGVVFSQGCPKDHCSQALNPIFLSHWARVCYGNETFEQRSHKVGHISNYEVISFHKHHVSIFWEFIPRVKSFSTHRVGFSSNYVSDKIKMNLTKWERFLSIIGQGRKTSFSVYTGVMVLEKSQNTGAIGELLHFWSDLGKIKFSHSWSVQMTCLMIQMITIIEDIFNKLSWAQFGVEEGLQNFPALALCISAPSFRNFWPILEESSFDRSNQLQSEQKWYIWNVDRIIFPKRYFGPNWH